MGSHGSSSYWSQCPAHNVSVNTSNSSQVCFSPSLVGIGRLPVLGMLSRKSGVGCAHHPVRPEAHKGALLQANAFSQSECD